MKKIALCYDFDGTLCSGYMQNQNSGKSICVYEEGNKKSLNIAKKIFSDGRVHHVVKGDYKENSKIDRLIKNIIKA